MALRRIDVRVIAIVVGIIVVFVLVIRQPTFSASYFALPTPRGSVAM